MSGDILTYIVVMAVFILMSAYFSATETAFSSINKTRLKTMAEKGNPKAAMVLQMSENYDKVISTILIGNNIVNIGTASIGTVLFVKLYGDIGATISTVVVTIIVLIFGEISPKSIAKDCPERWAMFSAPLLRVFIFVLTPLNFFFSKWKKLLSAILKTQEDSRMSQEELLMLLEEVEQEGSIGSREGEMLRNVIEFNDREAEDILTHRVDMEMISLDTSKEEIAERFAKSQYSRLPVYADSIDNIVGVLHQKDFYVGSGITEKSIEEIMASPVFVRKTEKISKLLQLLQQSKSHIAVVLDEYGGTYGIVTMEDILEELVGEIWDEHDEVPEVFRKIGEDQYEIDGSMDLNSFAEVMDIDVDGEVVSLGGWVMEQLGRVPVQGDSFVYEDYRITVSDTDCHRVERVHIQRSPKQHRQAQQPAMQSAVGE